MPRLKTCKSCHYPHEGRSCPNPACFANPNVSEATKADWRVRDARALAEETERERIREIRRKSANHPITKGLNSIFGR